MSDMSIVQLQAAITKLNREFDDLYARYQDIEAEIDRLREALRMALPHVKSGGDDTLAMVIRAVLAKEAGQQKEEP